ncbi:MAG TPA: hypothetical protein DCW83_06350 [Saprospirales bacterium]|nr:hypothetical protein [Saprospirales bacterium]
MNKIKLVAIILGLYGSNLAAQWDTKIIQKDSLYEVKLTETSDAYSIMIVYDGMIKEKAEEIKDSLDLIYNSKNNQLEEDFEMYNQEVEILSQQLKEAKAGKRKIERRIKRRDEKKVAKANK